MSSEPERDQNGRLLDERGNPIATEGIDFNIRPRRVRPKGWLERAIADGSVRDPELGPVPEQTHDPNATVVRPEPMVARVEGQE